MPDSPEVFVVGDMGEVVSNGKVLPQLGSVAMQSGDHVGRHPDLVDVEVVFTVK